MAGIAVLGMTTVMQIVLLVNYYLCWTSFSLRKVRTDLLFAPGFHNYNILATHIVTPNRSFYFSVYCWVCIFKKRKSKKETNQNSKISQKTLEVKTSNSNFFFFALQRCINNSWSSSNSFTKKHSTAWTSIFLNIIILKHTNIPNKRL